MLRYVGCLTIATVLGCSNDIDNPADGATPLPPRDRPSQMAIWPANRTPGDDSAWAGSTLVTTPAVRVMWLAPDIGTQSMADVAVSNITVRCAVTEGGGSIRDTLVVTDSYGLANCGGWTLGPNPGRNTVTVSVTDAGSVSFTTIGRCRPDIIAIYSLTIQEGVTDPDIAGGQLILGSDGTLELGQDYFWTLMSSTGVPMPPSRWRFGAYAITGSRLEVLNAPETLGEIRGDSLIVTTTIGDAEGTNTTATRSVYLRSDLPMTAVRAQGAKPLAPIRR
jgi:hypothetical protein